MILKKVKPFDLKIKNIYLKKQNKTNKNKQKQRTKLPSHFTLERLSKVLADSIRLEGKEGREREKSSIKVNLCIFWWKCACFRLLCPTSAIVLTALIFTNSRNVQNTQWSTYTDICVLIFLEFRQYDKQFALC